MEWDFRYLQGKYGDAGARDKFEEICHALMMKEYPGLPVHDIRPAQGDGGIDILVGDFSEPVHVFQCKFFLDKIGNSRKNQIRESFRTAKENPRFMMKEWTLLIPIDLSQDEMGWWSNWKEDQKSDGLSIDYWGQKELIAKLRAHGLYNLYFDVDDKDVILRKLDESVREIRDRLTDPVLNWRGASGLQYITCETVENAAEACTEKDVREYYRISNRFSTMFRVICAARDVPHPGAEAQMLRLLESPAPIVITGSGGRGKSSLMLRTAVLWAQRGRMALWLRLSADDVLTDAQAEALFRALADAAAENGSILLCIDNPFEGRVSFQALQRAWPTDAPIRLLLAERNNRLSILADQAEDAMLGWFDGANVIELGGRAQGGEQYRELGWAWYPVPEDADRQRQILINAVEIFSAGGSLSEEEKQKLVRWVLGKYRRLGISLAELIYRTLFAITQRSAAPNGAQVSKTSDVVLDWDEWDRFLEESHCFSGLGSYELIAAYKLFDTPLPLSLYCRYYKIDRSALERALERRRMEEQTEPVVYSAADGTLQPKHDVIAELFFLFHRKTVSINTLMRRVLDALNGEETDILLDQIVDKQEFLRGSSYELDIDYRGYLEQIQERAEAKRLTLEIGGAANLCLGRLWLERNAWKKRAPREGEPDALRAWLQEKAPAPAANLKGRDLHGMSKLYTEWGIWERDSGCAEAAKKHFKEALKINPKNYASRTELIRILDQVPARNEELEQMFREALEIDPKNLPFRTELGRLLAQDPARREEAEQLFRDALEIDPKNLHARTELGRLLAQDPDHREEAERLFRDALEIDPKNLPSRTELGRLLAQDPTRWKEAERLFREALEIDPKNLPSRTELGRLLAQDPARREEAERLFREALEIDPKNLPSRTELGRLLAQDPARREEAERLFREALEIDPKNLPPRTELGRLLAQDPDHREEAEQLFREALEIDPKNLPPRTELGRLLAQDPARREEAEQLFRQALEIDPKNLPPRTELGRLLAQDPARRKEAEQLFRQALEIDPKDLHACTELGRLLARVPARREEAEQLFRQALEIDPKDLHACTELGRLLARDPTRRKEAEAVLKDVINQNPRDIHSRDILARMYEKQGRYSEASSLYNEILKIKPGDKYAREGLDRVQAQLEKDKGK